MYHVESHEVEKETHLVAERLKVSLADLVGPSGSNMMACANAGATPAAVTTRTQALYQDAKTKSRMTRFLMQTTMAAQDQNFGDGSKLCGFLASDLICRCMKTCSTLPAQHAWLRSIKQCVKWIQSMMHMPEIEGLWGHMHEATTRKLQSALLPLTMHTSGTNFSVIRALLRGLIIPALVESATQKEVEIIILLIVEAFVHSMSFSADHDRHPPASIPTIPAIGLPLASSCLIPGRLISVLPPQNAHHLLPLRSVKIVVLNVGLDLSDSTHLGEGPSGILSQLNSEDSSLAGHTKLQVWKEMVAQLAEAGVNVLASQRVIHPVIIAACLTHGILPWPQLSVVHIGTVLEVSKCRPVGVAQLLDKAADWEEYMGTISHMDLKNIGDQDYLHLLLEDEQAQTLVIGAPTRLVGSEWLAITKRSCQVLDGFMMHPTVCVGGGYTEMAIAYNIRQVLSCRRPPCPMTAAGMESMASSLEAYALCLVPEIQRFKVLNQWKRANSALSSHLHEQSLACDERRRRQAARNRGLNPNDEFHVSTCQCEVPGWFRELGTMHTPGTAKLRVVASVTCESASLQSTDGAKSVLKFQEFTTISLVQLSATMLGAIEQAVESLCVIVSTDGIVGAEPDDLLVENTDHFL